MTQLNTTELDFDNIKNNLISYFKRSDGAFKDWNFKGSGLNHLIDLLAYNTHYNAMIAHTALNESYLDSAQVRANVVSHAKSLGYTPRSRTAAEAKVNIVFNAKAGVNSYSIPSNTQFTALVGEKTHTFLTIDSTDNVSAVGGQFEFTDVRLRQGVNRTQTFTVNNQTNQRYVIQDKNIDTSTIKVRVFDSLTSNSSQTYTLATTLSTITGNTPVYYINENSNGNYEIYFGNGVYGKRPNTSGRIVVSYVATNGAEANGANTFVYADTSASVNINSVSAVESASGGSFKENKESIKFHAPLLFTSQDRAVTSSDYKALVKGNIEGLEDVLAWGGEENDVQTMGSVYICAKPTGANILSDEKKEAIETFLQSKKMIGTRIQIVDATFTYLQFDIVFSYDKGNTILNAGELGDKIRSAIRKYNNEQLNNFNANYRHSKFLRELDNADSAILGTNAGITAYKQLATTANSQLVENINFTFPFAGSVDQNIPMMSTSVAVGIDLLSKGTSVVLEDRPLEGDTEKRQIYSRAKQLGADGNINIVDEEVGFLYPESGLIEIKNFIPQNNVTIRIEVTPRNFDVLTSRRNILQIDEPRSTIIGRTDRSVISAQDAEYQAAVNLQAAPAPTYEG